MSQNDEKVHLCQVVYTRTGLLSSLTLQKHEDITPSIFWTSLCTFDRSEKRKTPVGLNLRSITLQVLTKWRRIPTAFPYRTAQALQRLQFSACGKTTYRHWKPPWMLQLHRNKCINAVKILFCISLVLWAVPFWPGKNHSLTFLKCLWTIYMGESWVSLQTGEYNNRCWPGKQAFLQAPSNKISVVENRPQCWACQSVFTKQLVESTSLPSRTFWSFS